MLNNTVNTYLLIFLLVLFSCQEENNTDKMIEFPKVVALVATELRTEGVYMRYPFRIRIMDSCLYAMDLHASEYFCHRLDYPSMKYQRSLMRFGRAPGEYSDAENIRIDRHRRLWTLDANKRQLMAFTPGTDTLLCEIKLSEELIRPLDFDFYDDSTFIIPDYSGQHRICLVNREGEIVKRLFSVPTRKSHKADIPLAQAWRGFIDYNPTNHLLAIATQLGEVIELYNLKENKLLKVIYGKSGEPVYNTKEGYAIPDGIMGYSDVSVGRKHIYALFWGHTFKDMKKGLIKKEGGRILRVFDLKGNPVCQYLLDRHVTCFTVNEQTHIFTALDVNSNQPIVEYKLE